MGEDYTYANVSSVLRATLGLGAPDLDNPLHRKLYDTVIQAGTGATLGQRVVALRYVFNWELLDAGRTFAKAKADYERAFAKAKVLALAEPKMSVAKAEAIAEANDEIYELKLAYLLAEQRERAMRKFLDTLDAALENHRTDRADLRAGDRASAQGYSGGA
jgi:hypothetical protein